MSFQVVLYIVGALLISLAGGAAIIFAFSSWLGKAWANRIMENEKATHARELEKLRAEFRHLNQAELERLRADITRAHTKELEYVRDQIGRAKEDRTRKLQHMLEHYQKQIEEFYGPLFNMLYQMYVANLTQHEILHDANGQLRVTPEQEEQVRHYYQENYFVKLHDEIRAIIKSKLYLIEGNEMPDSFYVYLRHAAQERDQRILWQRYHIDTYYLPGVPWPGQFHTDIKQGFETAMRNYDRCLSGFQDAEPAGAVVTMNVKARLGDGAR
jgi:hypothetical protein